MRIDRIILFAVAVFAFVITAAAQDTGNATYYSNRLHGNRVSDGTRYHRDSMTCAHKTYPFGTVLRVRNSSNGNEVYVKVTDRGPFRRGCIVDLSYAAARQLDMLAAGVVPVEIERVEPIIPFRDIENTILPTLDFNDPAEKGYFQLAQADKEMEKDLKDKASKIAFLKGNEKSTNVKKQPEPRYRIYRDRLSAQSK